MKYITFLLVLFCFTGCREQISNGYSVHRNSFDKQPEDTIEPSSTQIDTTKGYVPVKWANALEGDYSFRYMWEYPGHRHLNSYGQLVCDGFCPEEIYSMYDSTGKIKDEYLKEYYRLVDTSHVFHTLDCEANAYEFGEAYFMNVKRNVSDNFYAVSLCNVSTHSSLNLYFRNDSCFACIDLISSIPNGSAVFYAESGFVKIDKNLFGKGILKAEFDIDFKDNPPGGKEMFWRGKIYSPIKNE